jgi:hypothetical protein
LSIAGHGESDGLPVTGSFQERFTSGNNLDEFKEWLFHPGMLFNSSAQWWGDGGRRKTPHEGLDLCLYRTKTGDIRYLEAITQVPVMFEGIVVKVGKDFLGKSAFINHDGYRQGKRSLYTIYGHLELAGHIHPGLRLGEGEIIGTIADTGGRLIPPHLHISVAWLPDEITSLQLDWKVVAERRRVVLLDPLRAIDCPYSIVARIPFSRSVKE